MNTKIDDVLISINSRYLPGRIARLKADPVLWAEMIRLEREICEESMSGDRTGLASALDSYWKFVKHAGST